MRLHVCGASLDFSAATGPSAQHDYNWLHLTLADWSLAATRTLRLTTGGDRGADDRGHGAGLVDVYRAGGGHHGADGDIDRASGAVVLADECEQLSHKSRGFRERGFSGALGWRQKPSSDRGAALTLTQSVGGSSSGGAEALLARSTLEGLAANDDGEGNYDLGSRRLELKLGYGLSAFGGRFTSTPEAGVAWSDTGRDWSLGWRLGVVRDGALSLELGVEATRR